MADEQINSIDNKGKDGNYFIPIESLRPAIHGSPSMNNKTKSSSRSKVLAPSSV